MLGDAREAFPLQANRYLPQELPSLSVLASMVLTRIESLHNPTGDVLGLKNCKNLPVCISRNQESMSGIKRARMKSG